MSLQFLDDPAPPVAGPERCEAVLLEAYRRRGRRQNATLAGLGALIVLVVWAAAWPGGGRVDVATGPSPTTVASPRPPGSTPSITLTPLPATGSSATNSGLASGDLGPPACGTTQLALRTDAFPGLTDFGAAGYVIRLVLSNASGSPCTLVTSTCDATFTIQTPGGIDVSRANVGSCGTPPSRRVMGPGDEWTADLFWGPLPQPGLGTYVARGSWRIGPTDTVVGTPAPFEVK